MRSASAAGSRTSDLVAQLVVAGGTERRSVAQAGLRVATPGPGHPARVADVDELVASLGLDPELRPRAVEVAAGLALARPGGVGAQPGLVHVRGGGVAAVPDDVDELAVGERLGEERDEVDVRRRLLAEAQVAVELDAEQPAIDEPEEPARASIAPRALVDVATGGLRGGRLVVVAHLREAPDAVAEERRARAGRADEEDRAGGSPGRPRRGCGARSSGGAARASGSSDAPRGPSSGRGAAGRRGGSAAARGSRPAGGTGPCRGAPGRRASTPRASPRAPSWPPPDPGSALRRSRSRSRSSPSPPVPWVARMIPADATIGRGCTP